MAIVYNRIMLIERFKRHLADGWPNNDFSISTNEINLYIDQAVATAIVGQVYAGAKISGVLEMPEAYLVTYRFATLAKDDVTNLWFVTLPQSPLSLPLGYSITGAYFADKRFGKGVYGNAIKNKRVPYREYMPKPTGWSYFSENVLFWASANDGSSLANIPLYVQMPSPRGTDLDAPMNLPDDAIDAVFKNVMTILLQRLQLPQDIVKDNLPAGNKGS